jgi:amino acid transporter
MRLSLQKGGILCHHQFPMSSRRSSQVDSSSIRFDVQDTHMPVSQSQEDMAISCALYDDKQADVEQAPNSKEDTEILRRAGLAQNIPDGIVKRGLKERHLQLIALGGAIGTGLFIGLGTALSSAGPLSTLIGYSIMGALVWMLMIAMGEMSAFLPVAGGFVHHASRFVDPALGSALGLMYWFSYAITLPTEISACSLVVSYWDPHQTINPSIWISIVLVICVAVNFAPVRVYGEIESVFSMFKVVVIIVLIIVMLIVDLGGGPRGEFIGARYWHQPGSMAQLFWQPDPVTGQPNGGIPGSWGKFLAFWNVFLSSAFAYGGTEVSEISPMLQQDSR